MNKAGKEAIVKEIGEALDANAIIYLADYSGLTVAQANDLRNRFRDAGVVYKVYKNTLIRLAMEKREGYDALYEFLRGPTAVAFAEEPSAPARVIRDFIKSTSLETPGVKAAYVDGAFYGPNSLDVLASLQSKEELLGHVVGLLMAPASRVIGAVQAPGSRLAGAIKAIEDPGE